MSSAGQVGGIQHVVIGMIRIYQWVMSPILGPACAFPHFRQDFPAAAPQYGHFISNGRFGRAGGAASKSSDGKCARTLTSATTSHDWCPSSGTCGSRRARFRPRSSGR